MGMQLHFSKSDLPDEAQISMGLYNDGTDWYIDYDGKRLHVNGSYSDSDACWFDIGSRSDNQMAMIKTLIEWRVCFQCS